MSEKRKRLADMSPDVLVSVYTFAVRKTWEQAIRSLHLSKNPGHSTLFQKELALKREILRRLGGDV